MKKTGRLEKTMYLCVGRGTRLTQTVALLDGYFQSLVDSFYEFSSQRRGPRIHHSQGTEVVFINNRMFGK